MPVYKEHQSWTLTEWMGKSTLDWWIQFVRNQKTAECSKGLESVYTKIVKITIVKHWGYNVMIWGNWGGKVGDLVLVTSILYKKMYHSHSVLVHHTVLSGIRNIGRGFTFQ